MVQICRRQWFILYQFWHYPILNAVVSLELLSLERMPVFITTKDDKGVEKCATISCSFSHIPHPQQCAVCDLDLCWSIDLSDIGEPENCYNWNFVQVCHVPLHNIACVFCFLILLAWYNMFLISKYCLHSVLYVVHVRLCSLLTKLRFDAL